LARTASRSFADNRSVATGVYLCCGAFGIDSNGVLARITDTDIANDIAGLTAAGLTVHYVMGIADESIMSGSWRSTNAVASLASVAHANGFDGYICDYEPASDYTERHAQLYAEFLQALSAAMHAVGKQAGFCSAGWGILDFWSAYRSTKVDICTSMTPTYNWLGNGEPLYHFVLQEIAEGAMPIASVGAGLGTMVASGYKPEWQYNWTEQTMQTFSAWLRSAANVTRMDFWRADIDHNWPPRATASFVFRAAAAFLL
jgi:hypothetical protein